MTQDQIALVQHSFRAVVPIKETAASLFYARLFEIDPSSVPLFARSDMAAQGQKLMAALAIVVGGLARPDEILPVAEAMARRHVDYGVTEPHYASVGAALLWTLEQGLGEGFTPEVKVAWTEAYALVAGVMTDAARAAAI